MYQISLNDFLTLMLLQGMTLTRQYNSGTRPWAFDTLEDTYQHSRVLCPRIVCKDGFSISIQNNAGNYCGSENGYRTFGKYWVEVEWGYPSEPIDAEKYGAELWGYENCPEKISDGVGRCRIGAMDDLLLEHGGIDFEKTIDFFIESKYEKKKE